MSTSNFRVKISLLALAIGCLVFVTACNAPQNPMSDTGTAEAGSYPAHEEDAENGNGLASYHAAMGYECADCHGDSLDEQSNDILNDGQEELGLSSTYFTNNEACLSCHQSWEKLAEKTSELGDYNPHESIHGTVPYCNECHKGHSEQKDICGECHDNGGQVMKGNIG